MNDRERENWQRIKDAMEASGSTDNMYYTRALAILNGFDDPLDKNIKKVE